MISPCSVTLLLNCPPAVLMSCQPATTAMTTTNKITQIPASLRTLRLRFAVTKALSQARHLPEPQDKSGSLFQSRPLFPFLTERLPKSLECRPKQIEPRAQQAKGRRHVSRYLSPSALKRAPEHLPSGTPSI